MAESQRTDIEAVLSSLPQPQLSDPCPTEAQAQAQAPAPAPVQARVQAPATASASKSVTAPVVLTPNRVPEHLMHKNRLQEHAQRSGIPLPVYQSHNEGFQHAPKFRASVSVDGVTYTSPNTFSHRKAAEQDVAKIALECISKKIKDEGCPLINQDTVFCKSILNEFAVKMNLELPAYSTRQSEALLPVFVSSLVFNGVTYTGEPGRSKKEAEQLAARAVIRTLLVTSGSATILSEIIKSKGKLYAALNKVKESNYSTQKIATSYVPTTAIPKSSSGIRPIPATPEASVGMHSIPTIPEATAGIHPTPAITEASTGMHPTSAAIEVSTGMHSTAADSETSTGMNLPCHPFKKPKLEPPSEPVALPIPFVPPVLGQHSEGGSSSTNKRRKNKRKANKKLRTDAQPCVSAQPLTQVPPCSVAQ